jgi:hypothetical protein
MRDPVGEGTSPRLPHHGRPPDRAPCAQTPAARTAGICCAAPLVYRRPVGDLLYALSVETSAFTSSRIFVEAFVQPLFVPVNDLWFTFGDRLGETRRAEWWGACGGPCERRRSLPELLCRGSSSAPDSGSCRRIRGRSLGCEANSSRGGERHSDCADPRSRSEQLRSLSSLHFSHPG